MGKAEELSGKINKIITSIDDKALELYRTQAEYDLKSYDVLIDVNKNILALSSSFTLALLSISYFNSFYISITFSVVSFILLLYLLRKRSKVAEKHKIKICYQIAKSIAPLLKDLNVIGNEISRTLDEVERITNEALISPNLTLGQKDFFLKVKDLISKRKKN